MKNSSLGVEENVACFLSYVLGWISGLIIILIEKKNRTIRVHAMQSIIVFGFLTIFGMVLGFIPMLGLLIFPMINIIGLIVWIILMVKAYQGVMLELPVISDLARQWEKKFNV